MSDFLIEQPKNSPSEDVRLTVARQMHNVHLERCGMRDPAAALLEERTGQRIVVIRVGSEWGDVQALEEGLARSVVEILGSQEIRSQLLQSSLRHDDNHDFSEAVRALIKKNDHRRKRRQQDPTFASTFDEFSDLVVTPANSATVQKTALGIIEEVLADIGTVIETAKRTDIIASSGRGVRLFRHQTEGGTQIVFGGFIDYSAYKQ